MTQFGGMYGRGTADALFIVRSALQKRMKRGLSTWIVLVDLIKAFDSCSRPLMASILRTCGVHENDVRFVSELYETFHIQVTREDITKAAMSLAGVRQGL